MCYERSQDTDNQSSCAGSVLVRLAFSSTILQNAPFIISPIDTRARFLTGKDRDMAAVSRNCESTTV